MDGNSNSGRRDSPLFASCSCRMWHQRPVSWHPSCPRLTHPSNWQRAAGVASQEKKKNASGFSWGSWSSKSYGFCSPPPPLKAQSLGSPEPQKLRHQVSTVIFPLGPQVRAPSSHQQVTRWAFLCLPQDQSQKWSQALADTYPVAGLPRKGSGLMASRRSFQKIHKLSRAGISVPRASFHLAPKTATLTSRCHNYPHSSGGETMVWSSS